MSESDEREREISILEALREHLIEKGE